jgi:hypothetical protein
VVVYAVFRFVHHCYGRIINNNEHVFSLHRYGGRITISLSHTRQLGHGAHQRERRVVAVQLTADHSLVDLTAAGGALILIAFCMENHEWNIMRRV